MPETSPFKKSVNAFISSFVSVISALNIPSLYPQNSTGLFADIREKCERLRCKMSRNHERKMGNFYQLEDFDIDDEDFRILMNRIEGLLDKQSKRKRKRKRRQRKTEKALTEEQLENKLENVDEKVKKVF